MKPLESPWRNTKKNLIFVAEKETFSFSFFLEPFMAYKYIL